MIIEIEKSIAEDLIKFKLRSIQQYIREILNRWNEESATRFLEKVSQGMIKEAENDAIDLKQLLYDEEELLVLMKNL